MLTFRNISLLLVLLLAPFVGSIAAEPAPIKFGILSTAQPARIHAEWGPLTEYIARQIGRPIEIVVPRGFEKMKEAATQGEVDFFYVNSYVYYRLKQQGRAGAIAQMQNVAGGTTSRSEFFVRTDSGIDDIAQLKGKPIALVSPMGAGGYLAPRAYLYKHGIKTQEEKTEVFSQNLTNSLHQVLLKDVPAGAMCGVNYRLLQEKLDTHELKIIAVTDDYAEDVIAARAGLDAETVKKIQAIVLTMSDNASGQSVLQGMRDLKVQKFVPYDPNAEAITRKLIAEAQLEP